jgi:hypothetical protein
MEKAFVLNFNGYWREPNISGLPEGSGIYGVYACTFNQLANQVTLARLIYLGESGNVRGRVASHEKWPLWRGALRSGEELCFNAALIGGDADRQRAEAAMIFEHKPPVNTEYVSDFPFDTTTITSSGTNALMKAVFTVYRTARSSINALAGVLGRR